VLQARVARARGAFRLEVALEAAAGATLVVVGESGAGKTTLLRLLAGLEHPDAGRIVLDGRTWYDAERGVAVPPWRREVGYVAQDYALFPHLTVRENVGFGLHAQGRARRAAGRAVDEALERLHLAPYAARRPAELSGGQQQRVALARAIVPGPRLLLLDEPMAALDAGTRRNVRGELQAVLGELSCVTVLVTHSAVDATVFGRAIAVVEGGRFTQVGPRDELLQHPRSPYVATLLGVNLLRGTVASRAGGMAHVRTAGGLVAVPDTGVDGDVYLTVLPQDITLHVESPTSSAQNLFRGPVVEIAPEPPAGERVRVALGTQPPLVAEVTSHAVGALGLRPGLEVYAAFKATGVRAYR